MSAQLMAAANLRGITRLCHFTPSRNLQHIAAGKIGILSTSALEGDERAAYNPTDLERLDRRKTHICTSIEYPNAWYFDRARQNEKIFPDWVVLLINPSYVWREGTLFSPRNAAAAYGRYISSGLDGFEAMYAAKIVGSGNATFLRKATHIPACPTDQQAEVLIPDQIHLEDINEVAVFNEVQGYTERARLRANGIDPGCFRFVVAPHMFQKRILSAAITSGVRLPEQVLGAINAG